MTNSQIWAHSILFPQGIYHVTWQDIYFLILILGYRYFSWFFINASLSALPFLPSISIALLTFMQRVLWLTLFSSCRLLSFTSFSTGCLNTYPKNFQTRLSTLGCVFPDKGLTQLTQQGTSNIYVSYYKLYKKKSCSKSLVNGCFGWIR